MAVTLETHARTTAQSQHQWPGIAGARILISVLALLGVLALGVAALSGGNVAITPSTVSAPVDVE